MGTVNGLGSEDSGPDINTQSLILPAGRQWEKDTGPGGGRRRGDGVHKKTRNNGESVVLYAPKTKQTRRWEEVKEQHTGYSPDSRSTSEDKVLIITEMMKTKE